MGEGLKRAVAAAKATQAPRKKVKSWWCQPCSQESYTHRCKYCGKTEAEEK